MCNQICSVCSNEFKSETEFSETFKHIVPITSTDITIEVICPECFKEYYGVCERCYGIHTKEDLQQRFNKTLCYGCYADIKHFTYY